MGAKTTTDAVTPTAENRTLGSYRLKIDRIVPPSKGARGELIPATVTYAFQEERHRDTMVVETA